MDVEVSQQAVDYSSKEQNHDSVNAVSSITKYKKTLKLSFAQNVQSLIKHLPQVS